MAKREYFVDLDLGGNKIENFRIESLDSELPTLESKDVGRIVYQNGFLRIWSGAKWETISAFEGDATGVPFTETLRTQLATAYNAVSAIGDNALVKQGALDTALDGKVDKAEGYSLISDAEKAKIGNLAEDANATYATKADYATKAELNNGLASKADNTVVVKSVNSKTPTDGAVTLEAADVGALADTVKYAANVTATSSGDKTTVQLKDQDGNSIGDAFSITQKTYSEASTTAAGLMSAADKTKLDGVAAGAQVNVIESITVDGVAQAVSGKAVALNLENYAKKTDISSVYRYAGSVTNFTELPAAGTQGLQKGDVYNVTNANGNIPAGTNYVWDGTAWDALAGIVDLSAYARTADVATSIENATKDLASTETLNDVKSELQTAINGKVAISDYTAKVEEIEDDIATKADAASITAGTGTKITYNAQGIVTGSAALAAADIPEIGADKITSGTLAAARLPFGIGSAEVPAITISGGSATVAHGLGRVPVSVMVTRTADGVVVYPAVAVDAMNITISSNLVTSAGQFTVSWVG